MQLVAWETPFGSVDWLVCENVANDGAEHLELLLVEHHVVEDAKPQTALLDEATVKEHPSLLKKSWQTVARI